MRGSAVLIQVLLHVRGGEVGVGGSKTLAGVLRRIEGLWRWSARWLAYYMRPTWATHFLLGSLAGRLNAIATLDDICFEADGTWAAV